MNVIMLGGNSDIGRELAKRFERDGASVGSITRDQYTTVKPWDLVVVCLGVLTPIGRFFDTDAGEWRNNWVSNFLLPIEYLRVLWPKRLPGASVCFFSGAGTSNSAATYSAYASSKIALFKMAELLDDEEGDCKFFILGPGMVRTKIQNQTLEAGARAMNYGRVKKFMESADDVHGTGTSHDRIYECLCWCMRQPKSVIGGRNVYVPDAFGPELAVKLASDSRYFKLRRKE